MDKPIYQQVCDYLLDEISSMGANTPILSERELAEVTKASRMTVRKAINKLVEEGYLYRDKNKGTFVADSKMRKRSISEYLFHTAEDKTKYKLLHFDLKDNVRDIAQELDIELADTFIKLVRLNLEDKKPVSIDEIYVVRRMVRDFDPSNVSKLLDFEPFLQNGAINQAFKPMIVPVQYARLLELKLNAPIIVIESKVYTPQGRVYAFIKTFSNPLHMNIEITL